MFRNSIVVGLMYWVCTHSHGRSHTKHPSHYRIKQNCVRCGCMENTEAAQQILHRPAPTNTIQWLCYTCIRHEYIHRSTRNAFFHTKCQSLLVPSIHRRTHCRLHSHSVVFSQLCIAWAECVSALFSYMLLPAFWWSLFWTWFELAAFDVVVAVALAMPPLYAHVFKCVCLLTWGDSSGSFCMLFNHFFSSFLLLCPWSKPTC